MAKSFCTPRLWRGFGGADEVVVGEAEPVPQPAELAGDGGRKLLRRAASLLGGALDLLPVLVGAGQKPGFDAQRALAPRDGVAHDGRVGVAQVRPRIHVVDGRGEIEAGWSWESGFVIDQIVSIARSLSVSAERTVRTITLLSYGIRVVPAREQVGHCGGRITLKIKDF